MHAAAFGWLALALLPRALAANDPCSAPANDIVEENCKRGVSSEVWDVNGAGCPAVRGFATEASVLPGDVVEFKLKLSFGEALARVDVFRLGYYGGLGARLVGKATLRKITHGATCREGVAYSCAKWPVAAAWHVEGLSGLYMARFVLADQTKGWRADASPIQSDLKHAVEGRDAALPPEALKHAYGAGGKNTPRAGFRLKEPRASAAYFVVRSPATHDLLFQTADLTWHAYNGYGGLTTYGSFHYPYLHEPYGDEFFNLSDPKHIHKRAHARSYDTPLITRGYRSVNAPLGPELAAIRFLERMGYDLHYASGFDLSGKLADNILKRSRSYVSVGHDEYWTYGQRDAVERARKRGVHLNFWSANEAYWAVRLEGRTMICYKETQNVRKLDRHDAWTGTFRDGRSPKGARPENALAGHLFVANAQRMDSLFVDGERFGQHRAWRNTTVGAGAAYHTPRGVLGHEWDEIVDNGWSPSSLQRLSSTTIDNVQCLKDVGAVFDSCSATHNLVLSKHPESGAWTFGAGTVQWSWALDDFHDVNDPQRQNKYAIRVEKDTAGVVRDLQQLTVNVFQMQGVRPATLHETLVLVDEPDDDEPPTAALLYANIEAGVLRLSGTASDAGGVVASVEVSWSHGRWHIADLDRVAPDVRWTLTWGHEAWHALHGDMPGGDFPFELRVSDDSGNVDTVEGPGGRSSSGGGEL